MVLEYPSEALSIPIQLIVLIISSLVFAAISIFLYRSFKSQKEELILKIKEKFKEFHRIGDEIAKIKERSIETTDMSNRERKESKKYEESQKEQSDDQIEKITKMQNYLCLWNKALFNISEEDLRKYRISKLEKIEKELNTLPSLCEIEGLIN